MLSQKRIGLGPWLALGILCPLCLFLSQACLAEVKGGAQEGTPSGGSSDPHDWLRFNPYKFQPAMRLVPNASAVDKSSNVFQAGQTFAHDPTKSNIVFGRGTKSLPTAIYAKAFDVLQIGGKYYQAPGAGGSKQIVIDGEVLTIFGTTVYTPLPDNRYVGNPGQVSPFDPTKIFYKDNGMWPSVIYGEPGKELTIAGKKVTVPAAGQVTILTVGKDGHLKVPGDSSSGSQSASSSSDASGGAGKPSSQTSSASSSSSSSSGTSAGTSSSASANANHGSGSSGSGSGSGSSSASGTSSSSGGSSSGAGQKDNSTTNANQSSEKAAAEKAAAEKAAAEKAAAERLAAEKVAAERAAAEKAAAEKAAAEKAAAERDAAEKAAAEKALAEALANMQFDMSYEKAAQALTGEWGLINTSTTLSAKLKIQANGAAIEGIITDQGSGYIPAGKTRFSGTITGNPFQVTVLRAYPGFTDPYNESGSLAVTSATDIKITAPTGNLVLRRLSAISSQQSASGSQSSSSSSSSSSSGTQQISQPAGSGSGSSSNTSNSSQGTQSDISCP